MGWIYLAGSEGFLLPSGSGSVRLTCSDIDVSCCGGGNVSEINLCDSDNPRAVSWDVMPFEELTNIKGPLNRHVEALWAEIKSLQERLDKLERVDKKDPD